MRIYAIKRSARSACSLGEFGKRPLTSGQPLVVFHIQEGHRRINARGEFKGLSGSVISVLCCVAVSRSSFRMQEAQRKAVAAAGLLTFSYPSRLPVSTTFCSSLGPTRSRGFGESMPLILEALRSHFLLFCVLFRRAGRPP
ncbi:unnamed protein product [Hapterophycus canaliculatus]